MEQLVVVERSEASSMTTWGQLQKGFSAAESEDMLEEPQHDGQLRGAKLVSIVAAVCLAVFCVALDNAVCQ